MRPSKRTKVTGAVAGLIVCAIGVALLLLRGPEPFGTILAVVGAGFSASMLASWWIHGSQN